MLFFYVVFSLLQMTITALIHATDKDLTDLGFSKKGDILSLRAFCAEKVNDHKSVEKMEEKKDLLRKILDQNKLKRRKEEPNSGINIKKSHRSIKKIQVGWLNYDSDKRRYIAVRQSRGG